MPIYEYGCQKCGREFEELVFSDTNPHCPDCGSDQVQKLMSKCCHTAGEGSSGYEAPAATGGGGGCTGCAGGHCATCGH